MDEGGAIDGGPVRVDVAEGLGLATLAAPPANALSVAVREGVLTALSAFAADSRVRAVVIRGEGRSFSAGLDIREVDRPAPGPTLADLCAAVEASPKPVVALIEGPALGGGAELAVACAWRVVTAEATLAFPDLALGLLPGAGGTQRLPRLVGVPAALDLILARRTVGAEAMRRLGLADGIVEGDPLQGVRALLRDAAARGRAAPPVRDRRERLEDGIAAVAAVRAARAGLPPGPARDAVDCVEAALLLPFGQGLAFEAERHGDSLRRPEARALRHLFLAERLAPAALLRRGPGHSRELTQAGEAVVERLGRAMGRAAGALVRAGADRAAVDAALVDWGMPAGPFGGSAGGAGPEGPALVRRINAAVAAEGARLVAEGVASAGDVDALAVAGLGIPRASGGPMAMAEAQGLAALCRDMAAWAAEDPVWEVPEGLLRMAGARAA